MSSTPADRSITAATALIGASFLGVLLIARGRSDTPSTIEQPTPPVGGVSAVFLGQPASEQEVIDAADAIVRGTVVSVSKIHWNQDSGQRWEFETPATREGVQAPVPFPLQDVSLRAAEVWFDAVGLSPPDVTFAVPGTGIGEWYNEQARALAPGADVVVMLARRSMAWREDGRRTLLTLSAGYQAVYGVTAGDAVTNAVLDIDPSLSRWATISDLRGAVMSSKK